MARLAVLLDLGLGYLSLERSTPTLSPGELQRLRLATQVRSNLFGVVYVLDEPSAGLHPADTEALLTALDRLEGLRQLAVRGRARARCDPPCRLDRRRRARRRRARRPRALQRSARRGSQQVEAIADPPSPVRRRASLSDRTPRSPRGWLRLSGVTRNNLRRARRRLSAGRIHHRDRRLRARASRAWSARSWWSWSQSSSAIAVPVERRGRRRAGADRRDHARRPDRRAEWKVSSGWCVVDQKPIGRTPRSNLATYTGLFDHVRKLFAATKAARARHYDAGRFSFNVAKGRCETCEGEGFVMRRAAVPAQRLCAVPHLPWRSLQRQDAGDQIPRQEHRRRAGDDGRRRLGILCRGAAGAPVPRRPAARWASATCGLASRRPSSPAARPSGSSSPPSCNGLQRGNTLYVLDEPTTGLHPADVEKLMAQLDGLVESGNTVIVVEHDMRVVAGSDWVIDIGPGAGDEGGHVVAFGTPGEVAGSSISRTAPYLSRFRARIAANVTASNELAAPH